MKKVCIFLLALIRLLEVHGQNTKLQEFEERLKMHPQQDTFRVNRLNELPMFFSLSTARRDSAATAALVLSTKLGYTEGKVTALSAQALTKDKAQSKILLSQALAIADKSGDKIQISKASSQLGRSLGSTEEKEIGLNYLLHGEKVAQSSGDKVLLYNAQTDILEYYLISNIDYPKALEWGLKGMHTAEKANCLDCLAWAWGALVGLYSAIGDSATSLVYIEKALEANKKLGNINRQILLLNYLGELNRIIRKIS
jgi:tetratricopeptide (TPR) repeat protein